MHHPLLQLLALVLVVAFLAWCWGTRAGTGRGRLWGLTKADRDSTDD